MISYKRRQLRNTCENVFFPAFPARAGPGKKSWHAGKSKLIDSIHQDRHSFAGFFAIM